MRHTLLMSAALLSLAASPVLAQSGVGTTQYPPAPRAGSQSPQPTNALPAGAATSSGTTPGSALGATTVAPEPMAPATRPGRPIARRNMGRAVPGQTADHSDMSAPPTEAYRGGAGSPQSSQASNTTSANTRSEIAPRLPGPDAGANTPEALLASAQRSLNQGRTGAAQEALERAETRVLSRTVDPSAAGAPDQAAMVQHIGEARRALGRRDIAAAKSAVAMAMTAPIPPRGPTTTTSPAPMGYAPPARAY